VTPQEERAGLRRAIAEEPATLVVRLAYSDWLEEHGEDEAAAFVRVAYPPAGRSAPLDAALGEVAAFFPKLDVGVMRRRRCRRHGLLEVLGGLPWRQPEGPDVVRVVIRHGLASEVACPGPAIIKAARAGLFAAHPIVAFALTTDAPFSDSRSPGMWWWLDPTPRGTVPPEVWGLLRGQRRPANGGSSWFIGYPDRLAAVLDLSAAVVAYGRRHARLPPLTDHRPIGTNPEP